MILLSAPRPRLPRTRRGLKEFSLSLTAPFNPAGTGHPACKRRRKRRDTSLTERTLKPVSRAASEAIKSKTKIRNGQRNWTSEILLHSW